MKRILFFLLLISVELTAQIIPASRKTDWSLAGYRGAIPVSTNVVNITSFGGNGNGISSNNVALQNAISSLGGHRGVIYFPSGNFLFTAAINLPDSVIIKGNSSDSTTLSFNLGGYGSCIIIYGTLSTSMGRFTANATKDSNFIMVDNPSLFVPNDYLKISQNDVSLLFSSWAYGCVGQVVQVKNIVGNRINLNSPLRKDYILSDSCKVKKMNARKEVGIECLKIKRLDQTVDQTINVDYFYAVNCWMKGVESEFCNFGHVVLSACANIEISGCYFHESFGYGDGGQGYGVVTQYTASECLIENNVFNHLRHSMLAQAGANGNVYGYNSSKNPYWVSGLLPATSAGDMVLHGNYAYLNLFEGNTAQNIVIDDSHGINGPYNTYFRNRADLYGIYMNNSPASNYQNIIGNEVTNTGFLKGLYTITGSNHLLHGNNIKGTIQPGGTTTLNDTSYFKKIKPAYFATNATWPSIGIPNTLSSGTIPAQQRQVSGINLTDCSLYNLCPTCDVPVSVSSSNITGATAKINWTGNSCAVKYRVRYRVFGTTSWVTKIVNAPVTFKSLTGLLSNTKYQYQLRTECNSSGTFVSAYSTMQTFTTFCNCAVPTFISVTGQTGTSANVSWTGNACAVKYKLQYRVQGATAWITKTINAPLTSKVLTGLTANTIYQYQLRSLCDSAGTVLSAWSATQTFSTTLRMEGEISSALNSMLVIPNPCKTCELTGEFNPDEIIISDILGRNISATFTESPNGYYINLHENIVGIFFVRNNKTGEVVKFNKE